MDHCLGLTVVIFTGSFRTPKGWLGAALKS
jgi:hypothetical protein